jgi:hypothetical protein
VLGNAGCNLASIALCHQVAKKARTNSVIFSDSLDAVVDYDGDQAHGDRDDRQADQLAQTRRRRMARTMSAISADIVVPSISRLR